jgi:hypothetical protein
MTVSYTCDLCGKKFKEDRIKLVGTSYICLKCYGGKKRPLRAIKNQPRNSLCQCGSGMKYKNCCLRKHHGVANIQN